MSLCRNLDRTVAGARAGRTIRWFLVLFLLGICSRGYGYYNQTLKTSPQLWMDVLHGTANAPEQYRIGVVMAAYWVTRHFGWHGLGLRLSQVFGLFDLLGSMVAVLLMYRVLEGSRIYRQASVAMQWFGSASFAALAVYAIDWTSWYQKAGTLPTAGLAAAIAWMWSPHEKQMKSLWSAAGILGLVTILSFVRADVALVLCLGVFAAALFRLSPQLAMPRGAAMVTSVAGVLIAAGVQVYLAKVRYPLADYGGVHAIMLPHDWKKLLKWAYCLIFLTPFLWTIRQALRRREWGEGAGGALLLAAIGYALLWITMGRLDEVRIFLPMALVTLPLTVQMAMRHVELASANAAARG